MPETQDVQELHQLEQKYRRLRRQAQWEKLKPKLPYYLIGAVLLAVIGVLLFLLLRRPAAPHCRPCPMAADG